MRYLILLTLLGFIAQTAQAQQDVYLTGNPQITHTGDDEAARDLDSRVAGTADPREALEGHAGPASEPPSVDEPPGPPAATGSDGLSREQRVEIQGDWRKWWHPNEADVRDRLNQPK